MAHMLCFFNRLVLVEETQVSEAESLPSSGKVMNCAVCACICVCVCVIHSLEQPISTEYRNYLYLSGTKEYLFFYLMMEADLLYKTFSLTKTRR
jgi:hypothetical protein